MRRIWWIILVCVVVAGGWYVLHSRKDDSGSAGDAKSSSGHESHGGNATGKNAPALVSVATAKTGDIAVYLDGLGNITPRSTVIVHSLVNGQLMQILFQEGQMVKKNDLLAVIDDRPFTAVLTQTQGLLTRDEALLAEAKLDLERYTTLWKQDSIAKQQLDLQTSLVKQYEGTVKNDQGQVDAAKVNLAYTQITSPVNGRVGLRQVDAGNIVHSTDTNGVVIVTELQPITALFTLPEDTIPVVFKHLDAHDALTTEAWDRNNKNKIATGTLIAVDNQVDATTGTVKFRAEFANEDNALFPSQFVNIKLKLDTLKDAVTVPTSSIQRGTHGAFVYKVNPDKTVAVQEVTLGPADGENISVQKGVVAGDQVVVDGADTLKDGIQVEIASGDGKSVATSNAAKDADKKTPDAGDGKKHHKHKKSSDDTSNAQ